MSVAKMLAERRDESVVVGDRRRRDLRSRLIGGVIELNQEPGLLWQEPVVPKGDRVADEAEIHHPQPGNDAGPSARHEQATSP